MAIVEHRSDVGNTKLRAAPKVQFMERIILALLLIPRDIKQEVYNLVDRLENVDATSAR